MVRLEYLRDLYEHPTCQNVKDSNCLVNCKAKIYWLQIDNVVRRNYGASLTAYVLYEHHFQDKSTRDLSDELSNWMGKKVSSQRLYYFMQRLGVPLRSRYEGNRTSRAREKMSKFHSSRGEEYRRKMSQALLDGRVIDDDTIASQYTDLLMNLEQIADIHGVSPSTISNHLRRKGVEMRPATRKRIVLNEDALVYQYTHLHMSTYQIACAQKVSHSTIWKRLRRKGVEMRPTRSYINPKKGKSYEEYYGKARALGIKNNLTKAAQGRWRRKNIF